MHINSFDHYQTHESVIHRLDARVKIILTIILIISNALLPDGAWTAFMLTWGLVLGASLLAKIQFLFLATRSLVVMPFALAAITVIFSIPGHALGTIQLGNWQVVVTEPGLLRFASIMIRSWVSVQMAILLTATTTTPDLIHAMRHLRVPDILVATISFMYRYLFVLSDEALRLLRAREARSAALDNQRKHHTKLRWRIKVAGNMAGQLFIRSYERSERVYNAMLARGYQGTLQTLNPHEMKTKDWMMGSIVILALVLLQIITHR
ncbi:MAG: cobalt ECF transporter T component CbiQ [Chloroflexota bacterium]